MLILDLCDGETPHECLTGTLVPRKAGPAPGHGGRPRSVLRLELAVTPALAVDLRTRRARVRVRMPLTAEIAAAATAAGLEPAEWAALAVLPSDGDPPLRAVDGRISTPIGVLEIVRANKSRVQRRAVVGVP